MSHLAESLYVGPMSLELQAVTNESGELVTTMAFEGVPSISSMLYRELMVLGKWCEQDPLGSNVHLDSLLRDMASALGCTPGQLLEEPWFLEVWSMQRARPGVQSADDVGDVRGACTTASNGRREVRGTCAGGERARRGCRKGLRRTCAVHGPSGSGTVR